MQVQLTRETARRVLEMIGCEVLPGDQREAELVTVATLEALREVLVGSPSSTT